MKGKIIKGIAGFYYVFAEDETEYECKAKGVFRREGIKPLVGDNVVFEITDAEKRKGNIVEIAERKNALIRPAVANVDQAVVIFALHAPDPNLNLLDRFLISMERKGIPSIILFNKSDLSDSEQTDHLKEIYEQAGYQVIVLSAGNGQNLDQVRGILNGKTTVFAGPSGVGKSTLTNQLHPQAVMETGELSRKIARGKHTTRHSELFALSENTFFFDTPGFTSLLVQDIEPEELRFYYQEFQLYSQKCRFSSCVHRGESVENCGVKAAVEEGKIAKERYESYQQIFEELKDTKKY